MKTYLPLVVMLFLLAACSTKEENKSAVNLPRPVSCAGGIPVDALADFDNPLPLFPDLNGESIEITGVTTEAKQYFDQGFQLAVGFNHAEAVRSFRYALEQDPECAMCYWGLAYALGPNYNAGMQPEVVVLANEAARKAVKYSSTASPEEQAVIQSMSKRYPAGPIDDRSEFDAAYTASLQKAHQKFPNNDHITALLAEAIMDQHPWDLWEKNGDPKPWTPEILQLIESVLDDNPRHAMSVHLYIHATEASTQPELALPYAKHLPELIPGAGHLVHMPSHTYIRTGNYHDGVLVNLKAVEVDSNYLTSCYAAGFYPLFLFPHNYHFLTACAALEGNSDLSLAAAHNMVGNLDTDLMLKPGYETLQHFWSIPMYLQVKFGRWDEILQTPKPDKNLVYPQGIWHYAQAMAHINRDEPSKAVAAFEQLKTISANKALEQIAIFDINLLSDIIDIAENVIAGELAAEKGNFKVAEDFFRTAIAIEDNLNYTEPPDWFFSVRHHLGPVLMSAGKYAEAEAIYREDLKTFPNNGWALSGLFESLDKQNKTEEAKAVQEQLEEAWQYADVDLVGSKVS